MNTSNNNHVIDADATPGKHVHDACDRRAGALRAAVVDAEEEAAAATALVAALQSRLSGRAAAAKAAAKAAAEAAADAMKALTAAQQRADNATEESALFQRARDAAVVQLVEAADTIRILKAATMTSTTATTATATSAAATVSTGNDDTGDDDIDINVDGANENSKSDAFDPKTVVSGPDDTGVCRIRLSALRDM
jgi:hypothetical protein